MDNFHAEYHIIQTSEQLESLIKRLQRQETIGVDLEADSMFHFKEKVCLIQIGDAKTSFVIDPLAIPDLSGLRPIFSNKDIKKIFHGSDYDVRSLYRDFLFDINNLFDTHLACRFLGYPASSLDALLQKHFHIKLDKKYQKKDWSIRPLSEEMVKYAAYDVMFLVKLGQILEEELLQKGRLEWVQEECTHLSKVRYVPNHEEPLYARFKGAGRLPPRSLAILELLLLFRKEIAEKKDRPVFKIIGNDVLFRIARFKPQSINELEELHVLSAAQLSMYGTKFVQIVQQGMEIPEHQLPVYPKHRSQTISGKAAERLKALKEWRDEKGGYLGMDPALICSKNLMGIIATINPKTVEDLENIPEMRNWQKQNFGDEIIEVIRSC